ncbi:MAG: MFS transporter [Muribaculaceae bacterium]|nr:MFS transporter [Muribaculaceae bacterium]
MKYVSTGNGKMPLISLLAILSISLTINLPGLAVSPMLGHLRAIFHSSEIEAQLLTSLPNLVMIPVVILAGRIATPKWQTAVLVTGLSIFFLSGLISLFADSMGFLIFLGCMGGVGCGLVVPIAAGAISEWFMRKPRQEDLGLKSTTSNAMVIVANIFVGIVATINWHSAFAVYMIPLIPLCLVPFMTQKYIRKHLVADTPQESAKEAAAAAASKPAVAPYHFQGSYSTRLLIALIVLYVLLTYCTTSISYYAPFMMEKYGMNTTEVGIVTAAYYGMVALSGAFVGVLKRFFGKPVMFICLAIICGGLIIIGFTHNVYVMTAASLCTGFAYGIVQPIIYNKTTYIAPSHAAGMKYFGYVLSSNYLSIMMVPFVDSFFRNIFHSTSPGFEFVFSGVVVAGLLVWALIERKNYVFAVNPATAAPSPEEVARAEAYEAALKKGASAAK